MKKKKFQHLLRFTSCWNFSIIDENFANLKKQKKKRKKLVAAA